MWRNFLVIQKGLEQNFSKMQKKVTENLFLDGVAGLGGGPKNGIFGLKSGPKNIFWGYSV